MTNERDIDAATPADENEFEEPVLLDADDLTDVAGGCWFSCSNGDCGTGVKQK